MQVEARRQNGNVCVYRSRSLPQPWNGSFRNVQSGRLPSAVGRLLTDSPLQTNHWSGQYLPFLAPSQRIGRELLGVSTAT